MTGKTVTVSVTLPEPPDGWEWDKIRIPNGDLYLSQWGRIVSSHGLNFVSPVLCCRRVHKFPSNAVGTFYPNASRWHFTDGQAANVINGHSWVAANYCFVPATVFSDFTPPPERRPYRVENGVEVKDGAK